MNSRILKLVIATLALVFTAVVAPAVQAQTSGQAGGVTMTNVCHWDSKTSSWKLLSLPQQTLAGHLAHGDGFPNQPVPNQFGYTFNASCVPVKDPPLAVTVTERKRADGWVTLSIAVNRGAWAIKGVTCQSGSFRWDQLLQGGNWWYTDYSANYCGALQQTGGNSSSTTFTTKVSEADYEWQLNVKVQLLDDSAATGGAEVWPPLTVRTYVPSFSYDATVTYTVGRGVTQIAHMECSFQEPDGSSSSVPCGTPAESLPTRTGYSQTFHPDLRGNYGFTVSVTFTDGTSVTKQGGFGLYGGRAVRLEVVRDESYPHYLVNECGNEVGCVPRAEAFQPFKIKAIDAKGNLAGDPWISLKLSTRVESMPDEVISISGETGPIGVPYDAAHEDYYVKVTNAADSNMTVEYSLDLASTLTQPVQVISANTTGVIFQMNGYTSTGQLAQFQVTTAAPTFYDPSTGLVIPQSNYASSPDLVVTGEINLGNIQVVNTGGDYTDYSTPTGTFREVTITDPATGLPTTVIMQVDFYDYYMMCIYDEPVNCIPPAN